MAEYMNPFAGSMLPETVPNNPFMSRFNQLDNQQMMAPFMQMEQQRQQQALQKSGMDVQEYGSPEAVNARRSTRTALTSKNKLESAEVDAKLATMPEEQKIKILGLKNQLSELEGTPQAKMLDYLTEQAGVLAKTPEAMRPATYANIIKQFQMTHPNQPIPPEFQQYSPAVGSQLSDLRTAHIMSPKHVQEIEKAKIGADAVVKGHELSAGATVQAARIHAGATKEAKQMEIDAGTKQNPGQFRVAQRRILSNPNSSPEQREMAEEALSSSIADDMPKLYQSDPILTALSISAANGNQDAIDRVDARKKKLFEDHMVNNGIRARVKSPDGKVGTIPRSQLEAASKAGYKEVK